MKRVLVTLLVLANVAVFFVYWQLRTIERAVVESADTIPAADFDRVLVDTDSDTQEPVTFLIIGSDSREGLDDLSNFGPAGGERADVIILLQIHPDDGTAQMLSIPRDLWVEIPGQGSNKINAAFAFGGAPLMVETVSRETGININHYMQVDFVGFQAIVDQLGGVPINFPFPARDSKSGLNVDAGTQTLDGQEALAFARSRSYQELQNGSWVSVDANDIGRTRRQQQLIFSIIRTVARPSSIPELGNIVESFAEHLTIDARLAQGSMIELGWRMRGVRPDNIAAATLPTFSDTVGDASVERRLEPDAGRMLAAFRAGESLVDNAETLRISVLNGNGIAGSATDWSDYLESLGFDVASIGDADRKNFDTTTILVRPEDVQRGTEISEALGFGIVEVGTVGQGIDALVVMGTDVANHEALIAG
ncbi:MAG TPA: LCP family protein [Acidimicrobiia bacterium]|nr:LCP family protein [Acidimicrobiia bacterium]